MKLQNQLQYNHKITEVIVDRGMVDNVQLCSGKDIIAAVRLSQ